MSEGKFSAILSFIVPPVVEIIARNKNVSEIAAAVESGKVKFTVTPKGEVRMK